MKVTPEIEAKGLRAYEQVGAFEQLRRRRLPLIYAGLATVWIIAGLAAWRLIPGWPSGTVLGGAAIFVIGTWYHWQDLKVRYARNLEILQELEAKYGDQLSWVQVEKHFAALEKIQQEEREARRG